MSGLVGYLVLFVLIGVGFIFIHLVIGKLVRPARPDAEKMTIYECGEPTIGSAWIQFDLRFYVVALLFVIFDVEVAFFFPWAVVFGQSNSLAHVATPQSDAARLEYIKQLKSLVPAKMRTKGQEDIVALENATDLLQEAMKRQTSPGESHGNSSPSGKKSAPARPGAKVRKPKARS